MSLLGLRPSARPALIDSETGAQWTYREVMEAGQEAVAPIGRSKEVLFLLSRNDAFSVTTYAGALLAGHAVAFLDGAGRPELNAGVVSGYRPGWLAGPTGTGEALSSAGVPVERVVPTGTGELVRTAFRPADDSGAARTAVHPDLGRHAGHVRDDRQPQVRAAELPKCREQRCVDRGVPGVVRR